LVQGWITPGLLCPLPLDLGGKPRDKDNQSHMMNPGAIFSSFQFSPAGFGLGFLVGSLNKVALTPKSRRPKPKSRKAEPRCERAAELNMVRWRSVISPHRLAAMSFGLNKG
jgi:hypothetical protein